LAEYLGFQEIRERSDAVLVTVVNFLHVDLGLMGGGFGDVGVLPSHPELVPILLGFEGNELTDLTTALF
jgi:hypothetical protein